MKRSKDTVIDVLARYANRESVVWYHISNCKPCQKKLLTIYKHIDKVYPVGTTLYSIAIITKPDWECIKEENNGKTCFKHKKVKR